MAPNVIESEIRNSHIPSLFDGTAYGRSPPDQTESCMGRSCSLTAPPSSNFRGRHFLRTDDFLWRILHYEITGRALHAIFIRTVINHGMLAAEIVERRRRRNAPLQLCRAPGICRRSLPAKDAVDEGVKKYQLRGAGEQCGDGDELMHGNQWNQIVVNEC